MSNLLKFINGKKIKNIFLIEFSIKEVGEFNNNDLVLVINGMACILVKKVNL